MDAVRVNATIEKDGELSISGLPFKKGEQIQLIIMPVGEGLVGEKTLTARMLRESGLIGIWKDRTDIDDSSAYARQLREQAQRRSR